jgi:hypothetical protein
VTSLAALHKMMCMKILFTAGAVLLLAVAACPLSSWAQKDTDEGPTCWIYFLVIKDDNGKPVRNAAVIMHPVNPKGKQERGGMELKTDPDGKTNFEGIPYGMLRVQVLARGFQTYGEDFDIEKSKVDITIKLKRPQTQYSVYDNQSNSNAAPKQDAPPPSDADKKPN